MDTNAPIKVYMTRKLIGVEPNDSIRRACEVMVEFDIGSLVVVENGKVVGFFTKSDVIRRVVIPGLPNTTPVREIMSGELISVDSNTPLREVLDLMAKKGIKHMLIEENGEIVGIFSLSDLLTASRRRLETAIAAE
ncbi:CBS domain-containing protein [Thermococcus thioreducens]|uniref:CBS domain-containing protein n=1 Tax=Thermococcus thioreducens TaxID=277988 RepID=A0A0Q2QR35_9EURY|nr:CBS domain-containing protein [Thermococcus thioreducens]ASJ12546.1 inosine-5-monophosphate dehydrogenase [Thermococcus thioreducens]KQH82453.1 inosine-5-monophosphate dehydrogenase [Thermococcus thioreducens]SEV89006.1 CBS domain-containing protein [Thermococcus thioreducens]